ncbi:MAG: L,D-transpeptidase family protein [Myxococcota bacterium]
MAVLALIATLALAQADSFCEGRGTALVVSTGEHLLIQCEADKMVQSHAVSLGKGGTGKTKRGDNKTPLGSYPLGRPRASKKFGMFIPIAYPTPQQAAKGYTGGDIGVHGPARAFTWAGRINSAIDWTQGCIALASDEDIGKLASWVRLKKPRIIHIEP